MVGGMWSRTLAGGLSVAVLVLCGCGDFFTKNTGGGGGGSTGNYTYIGTQGGQLASYSVSTTGTLTALSGSPQQLATSAINSLAVNPANSVLYAAVAGSGVFGLRLNSSTGVATLISTSPLTTDVAPIALAVDPSGAHLLVAGLANGVPAVGEYSINADGTLGEVSGSPISLSFPSGTDLSAPVVQQISIAPNSSYVFVSLGQLGVAPLPFNTAGNLSANGVVIGPRMTGSVSNQDLGLAIAPGSGFLFVGETNQGVRVFSIAANNNFGEISGSPFASGNQPRALALDGTGANLYTANTGDNTISGFTIAASGALAPITGSPFSSVGTQPAALTLDQSKKYLIAANLGNSPNAQYYSFSGTTAGALVAGATVTVLPGAGAVASTR